MELKIKIKAITIKDENSGEEITIKAYRKLEDIAAFIEEEEMEYLRHDLKTIINETEQQS